MLYYVVVEVEKRVKVKRILLSLDKMKGLRYYRWIFILFFFPDIFCIRMIKKSRVAEKMFVNTLCDVTILLCYVLWNLGACSRSTVWVSKSFWLTVSFCLCKTDTELTQYLRNSQVKIKMNYDEVKLLQKKC